MSLLIQDDSVTCPVCGAVRAIRNDDDNSGLELNACQTCWRAFKRWNQNDPPTEDDFNRWLARKIFLDIRRLNQNGVLGRCEAVSDWMYGNRGKQCASVATTRRAGRLVCGKHLAASDPPFVEDGGHDRPYQVLGDILKRLVRVDPALRETLRQALKEISTPPSEAVELRGAE